MALDNPPLLEVLTWIRSGQLQLPDFQREWKWDDQRIRELIATVTLDYPLGVVMTLKTGGQTRFRARPLTGADASAAEPEQLLLDGQQRLTSLYQALFLDQPVQTIDSRNNPMKVWYYVDIATAVGSPNDRDDAIVSVRHDTRAVRHPHTGRPLFALTDTAAEVAAGYFPLRVVFDPKGYARWRRSFIQADEDKNWDLWSEFENAVIQHIKSFAVPMINLGADTTPDAVCAVFERVNTGGVPLNVFELLTATYSGNREYEHEHGDYYRLPVVWADIKKGLATARPVYGNIDAGTENGLTSSDFLQTVALVRTWKLKQQRPSTAVSCKRRDLLNLPLHDFDELAPVVRDAFAWVGDFLADQCIVTPADLPYRSQLIPLAAVRAIIGERTDEPAMFDLLTRWYWCGVLGEMYGGSTESRFARDVEQLVAWTDGRSLTPDTISEAIFVDTRLDSLSTRNSAAYKGIIALLIKQGAIDWYFTSDPMTANTLVQYAVDIRQVFPKRWLARFGVPQWQATSIVNKTPLSDRANKSVVGAPSNYLPVLAGESGTREEWFDDIVATHLIDPALLHADNFDEFYEDRKAQLLWLVSQAMGKSAFDRNRSEV
ncbi:MULTISPECIES: GmrSD restriction endonuclease domain-containing protein [unclassified Nocardia]|uniref:GmrSD restriction endonuclease domain-containing protein n=1 Tax=unclassified Nocardia TaxID=2637762 RepID=UPI0033B58155